jgi:hypothetical protein
MANKDKIIRLTIFYYIDNHNRKQMDHSQVEGASFNPVDVGLPRQWPWIMDWGFRKESMLVVLSACKQDTGHDLPSFRSPE